MQIEHVARHAVLAHVALIAANALIATGAEGQRPLSGQQDHADRASLRAFSKASASSNSVLGRKALRTSGRLIVILAMPSAYS